MLESNEAGIKSTTGLDPTTKIPLGLRPREPRLEGGAPRRLSTTGSSPEVPESETAFPGGSEVVEERRIGE